MKQIQNQAKSSLALFLWIYIFSNTISCKDSSTQSQSKPVEKSSQIIESKNENLPLITVYKSPSCGCCENWEEHLQMNGFKVNSFKEENMQAIKSKHGVGPTLASCHTAIVDGYVIEGHVPASDIKRLLKERPAIAGLSAPGMPQESPGMQAHDKKPAHYDVISFTKSGKTKVYRSY